MTRQKNDISVTPDSKELLKSPPLTEDGKSRSNSIKIDKDKVRPLERRERNFVNGYSYEDRFKDGIKIAVYSQEAFRRYATNYHTVGYDYVRPQEGDISESDTETLAKTLKRSKVLSFSDAFTQLFKDKESPHVVAILEGETISLKEFNLKEGTYNYVYKRVPIIVNSSEGHDARQNIFFYIREDMAEALTITQKKVNVSNSEFMVGAIEFKTQKKDSKGREEQQQYSMLITHIPNKFVNSRDQCNKVHRAFEQLSKKEKVENNTIVVGYMGDTNYKGIMQPCSIPSVGGNVKQESKPINAYVTMPSSPNKLITFYMQAVTLGEANSSFLVAQPNALNLIDQHIPDYRAATDHCSIATTIVTEDLVVAKIRREKKIEKVESEETETETDTDTDESILDSARYLSDDEEDFSFHFNGLEGLQVDLTPMNADKPHKTHNRRQVVAHSIPYNDPDEIQEEAPDFEQDKKATIPSFLQYPRVGLKKAGNIKTMWGECMPPKLRRSRNDLPTSPNLEEARTIIGRYKNRIADVRAQWQQNAFAEKKEVTEDNQTSDIKLQT